MSFFEPPIKAPVAQQREHVRHIHGTETDDPWHWLQDSDNPEVAAYLSAENAYTEYATAHLSALRAELYCQMRDRISETHDSLAAPNGPWEYFTRTVAGLAYPIYLRRSRDNDLRRSRDNDLRRSRDNEETSETVLLDVNALANDHEYFAVGDLAISPNHHLLAYTADSNGNELYELFVVDLQTGQTIDRSGGSLTYGLAWSNDNNTLFAVGVDEAHRADRVQRHVVGITTDDLVFQENDERFWVGISKTRSERFVVITSESVISSECHLIDANHPTAASTLVRERRDDVMYRVDHQHNDQQDRLLIVTNDGGAENFCLMKAALHSVPNESSKENSKVTTVGDWSVLIKHRQDTRLEDIDCFEHFVVVQERTNATPHLRVLRTEQPLALVDLALPTTDGAPYEISPADNLEYDTSTYRYEFTSMITPPTVFETAVKLETATELGEPQLLYQSPIANGVDLSAYRSVRLWTDADVDADNNTQIPISVIWRPDAVSWPSPCLLYGYGAYEVVIPATFSQARISLLDRGVVFAIAHVRGGGELGRAWHSQGRLQHKQNTFDDFVACARHLIDEGWTEPTGLVARGASAGGLLMGAVINQAPELFAAVVAEVPFVDVVNTMLDASIPLTVTEFDEWGDPSQADSFQIMRSYAPYENVENARNSHSVRPALLVTAGLHDSRVQYWEPAKWVAKLRNDSTRLVSKPQSIFLRTQMSAGHGGASGRYDSWRDEAFVQAFVLAALDLTS